MLSPAYIGFYALLSRIMSRNLSCGSMLLHRMYHVLSGHVYLGFSVRHVGCVTHPCHLVIPWFELSRAFQMPIRMSCTLSRSIVSHKCNHNVSCILSRAVEYKFRFSRTLSCWNVLSHMLSRVHPVAVHAWCVVAWSSRVSRILSHAVEYKLRLSCTLSCCFKCV